MSRLRVRLILLSMVICMSQSAVAELRIEITKGQGEAVPIAVVPFGWTGTGEKPYEIAEVISADLAWSGVG